MRQAGLQEELMITTEISPPDWRGFTEDFSRNHTGWMINLDVLDSSIGAQRQLENWPLGGVTYEGDRGTSSLIVTARDPRGNHLSHPIQAPTRMWLEQRDDGADMALVIESESGRKTLLQFRHPLLAEMLDPAVE